MDLADFLAARVDEDETAARDVHYVWPTAYEVSLNPERVLREVAAKRSILMRCKISLEDPGSVRRGIARRIMEDTAAVYRDHPDYDPAWAPV